MRGDSATGRKDVPARWRTTAETFWHAGAGRLEGWSHTEWFDADGRRTGEEWRRWVTPPEWGRPPVRPEPEPGLRPGGKSDRLADRLILAGAVAIFCLSLVLLAYGFAR